MASYVDTPIGRLKVVQEGDHKLAIVGHRKCVKCGAQVLAEKIGVGWTDVFVQDCYTFCCNPCCPHAGENPCPKERNEGRTYNPLAWPIIIEGR